MIANPLKTSAGYPLPYGATPKPGGINFALVSKHASSVTLQLYDFENNQPIGEVTLKPEVNKTGDVWHIFIAIDENKPLSYSYHLNGPTQNPQLHYFNPTKSLLDPYANNIKSPIIWGTLCSGDKESYHPPGVICTPPTFNWENDRSPQIKDKDLIIYEMHVRGYTQHPSSEVQTRGTFLGVIDKIPHLLELGINAVELMPIHEFNECEYQVKNPNVHERLYQYWGYSTANFFTPMNRYAASNDAGKAVNEFKNMVKALHKNGIKVILDIVLNHTNEGDETEPINSFKGIDSCVYYMMDQEGKFLNFTGCGNTVNTNHPLVQKFILDVLHYWVLEMHVDGFRFDLASIFNRGTKGEVLFRSPILESISQDPILSKTLLIAEPWDAVGLYQVGGFYSEEIRWSEWNAHYRDTVRQFIKGTPNFKGKFASCIAGSQDIYSSRSPTSSINFLVCHDGFTLRDLVSYNQKHNLSNGENNHDGLNDNLSWNCGKEGFTSDPKVEQLRERQMRNFHLALMMSQGIPMLLMGDEYAHTKKGNNNTWCHDNELNWFLWDELQKNASFYRYYRKLIEFRKQCSILRLGRFLTDEDIVWLGANGQKVLWDKETQFLAFVLFDKETGKDLYCAFNAQNVAVDIVLPELKENQQWHLIINTANETNHEACQDYYDEGERPIIQKELHMLPYSSVLLTL